MPMENALYLHQRIRRQALKMGQYFRLNTGESIITFDIMCVIEENPDCNQVFVAAHLVADKANIADFIRLLDRRGYLNVIRSKKDRRQKLLKLSPEGKLKLQEMRKIVANLEKNIAERLTADRYLKLMDALQRLENIV